MVSTVLTPRCFVLFLLLGAVTCQEYGSIVSTYSGLCGDIYGASPEDGAIFHQWQCRAGSAVNQQFAFVPTGDYYQIRIQHSFKCLGVDRASRDAGSRIVQMACGPNQAHQLWSVTGTGANQQIKASHSNLCMNIEGGALEAGTRIIQWNCGFNNDKFRVNASLDGKPSAWDGPYPMPLVTVAAANLADGRILAWSAYERFTFGGSNGRTQVSIFDPATNLSTVASIENTQHDMFCPGTAVLSDGRVMVTGGSNAASVTFYNPTENRWYKGDMMKLARGYHSMTVLSDGSVFTLGGSWSGGVGGKHGEVWSATTGEWDLKSNIRLSKDSSVLTTDTAGVYREDNHMWMFTAPNGQVFQAGPSRRMHWIDTSGEGRIRDASLRGDNDSMNGNAVMYDIGKILTLGGAPDYNNADASTRAYVIDINGGVGRETVKRVGNMSLQRALSASVILPSGEVVVLGGQSRVELFADSNSNLMAEIWNPATEQFTTLSSMAIPRNYHSAALLLNDGRVWAAGGGLCGNCATNHADAEILTPPYLSNEDGSLKTRPVIQTAPSDISPGDTLDITMDTADAHSFALLRLSAATHAVNNDQRRIPLTVKGTGLNAGSFLVEVPTSYSILVPGTYFLFALNSGGVPSVAKTVVVQQPDTMMPRTTTSMVFPIVSESFSGHCVDIGGGSQDNGANAIQWPCHGQQNQMFEFEMVSDGVYRVKAQHSQRCLTVQNAATSQGANVIQQTCQDQPHQLWTIDGTGSNQRLRVTHTKMCLNILGGDRAPGIDLVQRNCVGANNEIWSISDSLVTSGVVPSPPIPQNSPVQVQIKSEEFSGLCLDVAGAGQNDGTPIVQWFCQEVAHQLFTFQRVSDGIYRIVAQHSSKCLTIANASRAQGAAVIQQTCQDQDHQLWYVSGNGGNQQLKVKHTNLCLNNYGGSGDPGNRLIQWECRGGRNELWHISDALSAPQ